MTKEKVLSYSEVVIIVLLAAIPLFISFPYRVNIFISWEGAYRISEGELPFRDFGTALGGMYWVVPGLFFKIFGTQMITLVKAQFFINIVSGLAFRSILKSLSVQAEVIFISVCLFCFSYSFFNFWPWYNHSVIVYQFVGLAFLFRAIFATRLRLILVLASSLFICCSFLTKQDAGAIGFMIGLVLIIYSAFQEKKLWMPLVYFSGFILFFVLFTAPFYSTGFPYWFNHGQAPHTARVSIGEIIGEFFQGSMWIKFYLLMMLIVMIGKWKSWSVWLNNKSDVIFFLLTLGILGEAAVFQVTSYTPPDNNIFYHSFAFAFILQTFSSNKIVNLEFKAPFFGILAGVFIWWSSVYWKYFQRITDRIFPVSGEVQSSSGENIVNRNTYMLNKDTTEIPMSEWSYTGLKSFENIYMPNPTVDGINRLMAMELVKSGKAKKVLNMTELTPLTVEMKFPLERSENFPLWFHLGVSMFNKQAGMLENKISAKEYDMVLFEYIPNLNNFFPFRVRDSLKVHYKLADSFMAPRRGDTKGTIEVYVK